MRRCGFLYSLMCLALLGSACSRPPTPIPAELITPDAQPWPEQPLRLKIEPQGSSRRPASWLVSLGQDRAIVSTAQLRALGPPPAAELSVLSQDQAAQWQGRIQSWRLEQLRTARAWVGPQPVPGRFVLFVSPDCSLCSALLNQWPAELPLQVLPLAAPDARQETSPSVAFASRWCVGPLLGESSCSKGLWQNTQSARRLGVDLAPALLAPDGRLLQGWPDADWLRQWWNPEAVVGLPPASVNEPDL